MRDQQRNGKSWFLRGVGVGTGLAYFFDSDRGRRRRAMVRDKAIHLRRELGDALETGVRDLSHRARGLAAGTRSRLRKEAAPDDLLVQRIRAEIGRWVSHPRSVSVTCIDGEVTLAGPILAREVDDLLRAVGRVRGVKQVTNQLATHQTAAGVPGLQGEGPRPGRRPELMQENWAPAARLLMSTGGGGLALAGWRRGGLIGLATSLFGGSLFARAMTNRPLKRLFGVGAGRRAVDLHKTIEVRAPIDEVYRFWTHFENFPRFMEHVRSISVGEGGRSHWKVAGPVGSTVEWDATITRRELNRTLAWKTTPGATVEHAGIIHFEETATGGTRLDIQMSYNPPAGILGHAVATLFHKDPKRAMDEDLIRFKSLIEGGKASAHGQQVTREELTGRWEHETLH